MRYNPYDKLLDTIMYIFGMLCLTAAVFFAIFSSFTDITLESIVPPCLFYRTMGYYCPGCGGTRAVIALVNGHFIKSFIYHPFVLYATAYFIPFLLTQTIYKIRRLFPKREPSPDKIIFSVMTVKPFHIYAGCILLMLQWIIKNIIIITA